MTAATEAFASLAEDYARYRPGYPAGVYDELVRECGLTPDWIIADIGSGTGNLARLFLEAGHEVIGVEPNKEMREAGERMLAGHPRFRSVDGAAECIPLENQSVDLVTVGQAMHWFDIDRAPAEIRRILKPGGWVAVTWNDRPSDATEFTRAYSQFTAHCNTVHEPLCSYPLPPEAYFERIFGTPTPQSASVHHTQSFDLEGLLGRARSAGHIPALGEASHAELSAMLTDLFEKYQRAGVVEVHYIAQLRFGRLEA